MNKEPAFPGLHPSKDCHYQDAGMFLRDYFAAKVLGGVAAVTNVDFGPPSEIAAMCYRLSDAMLEARKK